ncbi:MAG: Ig-like domain-containing protein, partial [Opitutales bacterium]
MTALGLHAVTPEIISLLTDSVELGASYSYQITTAQDGTGEEPVIYNANGLPAGLSLNALTGEISGTPTESGTFSVSLAATNASNETGSATLELTVSDPLPDITSETEITAYVGSSFTYTITATNNPTTYAVIGLSAVPTDSTDTAALATTGAFSFTPSTAAEGGVYNLLVQATNDAGTEGQVLTVNVAPAAPSVATVVVNTPTAGDTYPGSATSVDISATVTPAAGEVIDTVFVRWNNPPAKPDGTPRAPIILSELVESIATPGLYETTVDIGFDPERLEIGGGSIDLEVVAYQTNAVSSDDAASDAATISIAPLLDVVLPEDTAVPFERGPYAIGDIFASARVSTNQFSKISARISGPGIVELGEDDDASDNLNSIFNFTTSQAIAFEGQYEVVVTVEDLNGNSTTVGPRTLQIAGGTAALPVATIVSPAPGFTKHPTDPDFSDPIDIAAEFFTGGADLRTFSILVNGAEVLSGNLDPSLGSVDVPRVSYPEAGSGVLQPGNYVVVARVWDANGAVGNSNPVSFQIVPYEPLEVTMQAPSESSILIGDAVTFRAEASPLQDIDRVEFYESNSVEKLGEGSRVTENGVDLFRFTYVFPQVGDFRVYAKAIGFSGQSALSAPVDISVESGEFPLVEITNPTSGTAVTAGENLEILIEASDVDGLITRVEIFNGTSSLGLAIPTGTTNEYRLNATPNMEDAGILNLMARATDDRGNTTDSDVVVASVVLGQVPQIEILEPVPGASFFINQPFQVRARITDGDGTITSATLQDTNTIPDGEATVPESRAFEGEVMNQSSVADEFVYTATLSNPDVVGLVVSAKDNSGNRVQSAPVTFTVTNGISPNVAI